MVNAARPALAALRDDGIPLVLVSSKTLAELEDYRQQLDLRHPVVAENGAVIDVPADYFPGSMELPEREMTRAELQAVYEEVKRAYDFECEAFCELGVAGIMHATGLTKEQAMRANDRQASEPVLWLDTEERAGQFEQEMHARGLRCIMGGRFLHVMGNTSKEEAVHRLLHGYAHKWPGRVLTSVSLGDGPNDLGMLASTDIAVVIKGKHEHRMILDSQNRVLRPASPGPAGWNEAILAILAEQQDNRITAQSNGG